MMSIVSFVTVSIAMVLYAVNSSYIKRLVSKSKEHENEMISRAVVQDNKIRNVVDAVNNNDEIANKENQRLEQHVSQNITDLLKKNKNTDDKLDQTIEQTNLINTNLSDNIDKVADELNKSIVERTLEDARLDAKFDKITSSNVQLTMTKTNANASLIESNSKYISDFEGRTYKDFERVQKNIEDNHKELFKKIIDDDARVKADYVEADDLIRHELNLNISNSGRSNMKTFNEKLNDYVMTSTFSNYRDEIDQFFSTKLETQSNSARIYKLESMNIDQKFTDTHKEIHDVENRFAYSNQQTNSKHDKLKNRFDDFKMYEYASFSNLVVDKQNRNYEDLKNTFEYALSNLDSLVDIRQDGFESHFASKDFVRDKFYDKEVLDELLDAKQLAITNAIKGDIVGDVTFRGLQGLQGDPGVGIRNIEKSYNEVMKKDYIDFELTDSTTKQIEVPAGIHGSHYTNLRIEGDKILHDKITYDLDNNKKVETGISIGTAPTNGIDGTNGVDGTSISEITTANNGDTTTVRINLSNGITNTFDIPHGEQGVSIVSVDALTNNEMMNHDMNPIENVYYNITLSNGTKQLISIPKGRKGEKGEKGDMGEFDKDNSRLSFNTTNGLCLTHKGINFGCIDMGKIKDNFYTKDEYRVYGDRISQK